MNIVLLLTLSYTVVYGQQEFDIKLPAADENYLINLQRYYRNEQQCLKRLDAILKWKWTQELDRIPTTDLGSVDAVDDSREPSKPMYNTYEQEWLMESESSARRIDSCMRDLIPDVISSMSQAEIDCLNSIFGYHIEEEFVHAEVFNETLKRQAREQLPFRRFVSFTDFVDLMYQSRTPDALNSLERAVYEHAESYLTTDKDRVDLNYILEQACDWKNAIALRQASNLNARLNEFVRQVKDAINRQLANALLKSWDMNTTLSRDKYVTWVQARRKMMLKINEEVEKLRKQKKDAQWLCEHATEFARKFSKEQANILVSDSEGFDVWINYWPTGFEAPNVAAKARGIEKALEKIRDFRHSALKTLADKYESGSMCLSAFLHLVQNHRRFDIALAFVDGQYNYPELYCKEEDTSFEAIALRFCKCAGSFCVHHGLVKLLKVDYALIEGPNGIYRVVYTAARAKAETIN